MIWQSRNGTKPERPAVLYLVHRVPYPPDKGDRIRAFHLLKYLSQHSTLSLACLADEPVADEVVKELRRYCRRLAIIPVLGTYRWVRALGSFVQGGTLTEGAFRTSSLRRVLRNWAHQERFHVTLASASSMAPYLNTPELREVPAVIDSVDVDSQKWFDYAEISRPPMSWMYQIEGRRLRKLEQQATTWARAVTLVSEAEADIYRGFCPQGPVHAVTNGVDLDYFHPTCCVEQPGCVFTGALDYRPNVEGVGWFCREVWGHVQRQRPEAKFYLVGRQPAPAIVRLAALPGVELVGQVPDVRPHVAKSAIAIAPLQVARGIQNKVLEALAMGKASIVSAQALAGLRARPGLDLLQAHTPAEWVESILRLLDDESLRHKLGVAGRRYVEEQHDWDRCLEPFGPLLGLTGLGIRREHCP